MDAEFDVEASAIVETEVADSDHKTEYSVCDIARLIFVFFLACHF